MATPMKTEKDRRDLWPLAGMLLVLLLGLPGQIVAEDGESGLDIRSELLQAAQAWAGDSLGVPAHTVTVMTPDRRARVQACATGWVFEFPFARHETLRAGCETSQWQLFLRLQLTPVVPVVSLAHGVAAGQVLADNDVTLDIHPHAGSTALTDLTQVIGRAMARHAERGEVITPGMLTDTVQVLRLTRDVRAGERLADAVEPVTMSLREAPVDAVRHGSQDLVARSALPKDTLLRHSVVDQLVVAVVARKTLPAGTRLGSAEVERRTVPVAAFPHDGLRDPEGLEGMESNRLLRAGEVVRASDLRAAHMVRSGQPVTVVIRRNGLVISSEAVARQDGRAGEVIDLVHPESGRRLRARITRPGEAVLQF